MRVIAFHGIAGGQSPASVAISFEALRILRAITVIDHGVITPTAALSSYPYTPEESSKALKHFYFNLGDSIWGKYGFYDAFSEGENWYPRRYLAIDQCTITPMIENYRTGLLWRLFMSCPEIQDGLKKLGFTIHNARES